MNTRVNRRSLSTGTHTNSLTKPYHNHKNMPKIVQNCGGLPLCSCVKKFILYYRIGGDLTDTIHARHTNSARQRGSIARGVTPKPAVWHSLATMPRVHTKCPIIIVMQSNLVSLLTLRRQTEGYEILFFVSLWNIFILISYLIMEHFCQTCRCRHRTAVLWASVIWLGISVQKLITLALDTRI